MDDPRYPIGKFQPPAAPTYDDVRAAMRDIARCPGELRAAVSGLTDARLDTPYREGGWTLRQVVHHVADSHLNAYVRMKLAMTEDNPPVKTYEEARWAELEDARSAPVEVSLTLLDSLHARWLRFMHALPEDAFERTFRHPESGERKLAWLVLLYGWHGRHHIAHITSLRKRMGW